MKSGVFNEDSLVIYELSYFELEISYNLSGNEGVMVFFAIKENEMMFSLIGKTRYRIRGNGDREKVLIKFIPLESGFVKYPEI